MYFQEDDVYSIFKESSFICALPFSSTFTYSWCPRTVPSHMWMVTVTMQKMKENINWKGKHFLVRNKNWISVLCLLLLYFHFVCCKEESTQIQKISLQFVKQFNATINIFNFSLLFFLFLFERKNKNRNPFQRVSYIVIFIQFRWDNWIT